MWQRCVSRSSAAPVSLDGHTIWPTPRTWLRIFPYRFIAPVVAFMAYCGWALGQNSLSWMLLFAIATALVLMVPIYLLCRYFAL